MDPQRQYADAHFPDEISVFGVPLEPLSIGHALLLAKLDSPFDPFPATRKESVPALGDVLLALLVLSRPHGQAARALAGMRGRILMKWWGLRFSAEARLRPWIWATVEPAAIRLARAVELARNGPRLWPTQEGGDPAGAPYVGTIKVALMRFLGVSESAALDYHLRRALWDTSIWWEMYGAGRIGNEDVGYWPRADQTRLQLQGAQ